LKPIWKKNLRFYLKTVTKKAALKAIRSKSAGKDKITQEQLILGAELLTKP
jgi:hypothetical protein